MELKYVRFTGNGTSGGKVFGRIYRAVSMGGGVTVIFGSTEEFGYATTRNHHQGASIRLGFDQSIKSRSIYTQYTDVVTVDDYIAQPHITNADRALHPATALPRGLI